MSTFDRLYRSLLITKLFTKGWGKPDELKRIFTFRKKLSDRDVCQQFVTKDYPVYIDKEVTKDGCRTIEGHFLSPFVLSLPGIMPKASEIARFQMILPENWKTNLKPVCVHLGGTGDHFFQRRRKLMALPLLKEHGIASIILENPYYGSRKPKNQMRSSLHYVSDLFVMGGAIMLECLVLFHWCERMGYGPLGVTGISMGGYMASLAATIWQKPLSLVPCLSWSTASSVYTRGVLSRAIPWKILQHQYYNDTGYETEVRQLIQSPEPYWQNDVYSMGMDFAKELENSDEGNPSPLDQIFHTKDEVTACKTVKQSSGDIGSVHQHSGSSTAKSDSSLPDDNLNINAETSNTSAVEQDSVFLKQPVVNVNHVDTDNSRYSKTQMVDQSNVSSSRSASPSPSNPNQAIESNNIDQGTQKRHYATKSSSTSKGKESGKVNWFNSSFSKTKLSPDVMASVQEASLDFMRGVMDECTHLGNFSVPLDPELIIVVTASHDNYIPRGDVLSLEEIWPGSEVRYINTGHIMGFLTKRSVFRQAIADSFQKQIDRYHSDSTGQEMIK